MNGNDSVGDLVVVQTSVLFSSPHLHEKDIGLYQNKVTSSLASTQHYNCKMGYLCLVENFLSPFHLKAMAIK